MKFVVYLLHTKWQWENRCLCWLNKWIMCFFPTTPGIAIPVWWALQQLQDTVRWWHSPLTLCKQWLNIILQAVALLLSSLPALQVGTTQSPGQEMFKLFNGQRKKKKIQFIFCLAFSVLLLLNEGYQLRKATQGLCQKLFYGRIFLNGAVHCKVSFVLILVAVFHKFLIDNLEKSKAALWHSG